MDSSPYWEKIPIPYNDEKSGTGYLVGGPFDGAEQWMRNVSDDYYAITGFAYSWIYRRSPETGEFLFDRVEVTAR